MQTTFFHFSIRSLVAVLACFYVTRCRAEEPLGLQPGIFVARMADETTIEFSWYSEKTITVEKSIKIDAEEKKAVYVKHDDGRITTDSVTELKPKEISYSAEEQLREVIRSNVKIDQLTAYGTDGQQIPPDKLPPLLKQAVPVVVSSNRSIIDPFYLSILKEGTLVFVSQDPGFPTVVSRPLPPPLVPAPESPKSPSDPG